LFYCVQVQHDVLFQRGGEDERADVARQASIQARDCSEGQWRKHAGSVRCNSCKGLLTCTLAQPLFFHVHMFRFPMMRKVVEDREVITGQGPTSADLFGKRFVEKLQRGTAVQQESSRPAEGVRQL